MTNESLSEARQRLLERMRQGKWQASSAAPEAAIPRITGREGPLSPGQEEIWFHAHAAGDAPIYNESITIRRRGSLDRAILERCLNEIARRHELWRSAFPMVEGRVVQQIEPDCQIALPFHDLSSLPAGQREAESLRLATDDVRRPFDLTRAPLMRWRLVRWSEDEHRLYLAAHHLLFDGVSLYRILISELAALYAAYSNGPASPLPDPPLQYRDYAAWKRQMPNSHHEAQLKYWRETLKDNLPSLELPGDRPRPAKRAWHGGMETCAIPAAMIDRIKALARHEGATPYMVLLAAFQVLLYRYSAQDEIVVGGATNTRTRPELEPLMGYFLNAVVYRTRVEAGISFRDFLGTVKTAVLGALANSGVPFDAIVRDLAPHRDPSRHPLFQVLFSMRPPFDGFPEGWDITDMEVHSAATGWDLYVEFSEHPEALAGRFVYSTELFDRSTIQRMQASFQELLENLLSHPDQPVSRAALLVERERRMLIEDWNNTGKSFPKHLLHELFEERVERNGGREALVFRGERLTYRELNARANKLAHLLREKGAAGGSFIGVFMKRSFEMVVALIAILKSGAAYVPYDPELPAPRINMMLEDTQPVCVITQRDLSAALADWGGETIVLDAGPECLNGQPESNPPSAIRPTDAIYAIYTSGSTGLPKAAVNTHEAVANRILWMQDQYGLEAGDRVVQKTPYSFDVSVWEFFWPLVSGATLVVAEPDGHRDPSYLAGLIARERISTIHFVPSMLREFLDATQWGGCQSIRRVFSSGEALPRELRQKFFERSKAELHNLYGPTEAAVDVTYWDCRQEAPCASVPIGRPIANVAAYILDQHLEPVPIGVAGELYVGGIAVARGYLHRPELTAERFIPNPFGRQSGERLYKTGDRARFLPDGNIEYLGRSDNQIKLRGLRIEPGEIESALLLHGEVRAAVVAVRQGRNGDQALVAYVVLPAGEWDARALRAFLRERLPEYMVPAHFVRLDALPMLSNGKLDRKALPAPESSEEAVRGEFIAPRTPLERQLAAIWERLLERKPIGISDNYFDLGGHSLLAVRLFAAIQAELGLKLPLATLYQAPTIESLARIISEGGQSAWRDSLVPIHPAGRKPPLYCVSGIGGGVLVFHDLAVALGEDQPFYALQPNNEDAQVAVPSIAEMARQYIESIQQVQPQGPYYLSGYSLGGFVAYEMAQQLTEAGFEIAFVGLFDTSAPLRAQLRDGRVARTYGTTWQRIKEIATAKDAGAQVQDIVRWRWKRLRARIARKLDIAPAEELKTLYGSQAFAGMDYVGKPYSGPITLFRSQVRPEKELWSYTLGWENLVSDIQVRDVPGDHLSIYSGENIGTFAGILVSCLELARRSRQESTQTFSAGAGGAQAAL